MKKLIDLLVVSSLIAAILAGCGPTKITVDDEDSTSSKVSGSVTYVTPVHTDD